MTSKNTTIKIIKQLKTLQNLTLSDFLYILHHLTCQNFSPSFHLIDQFVSDQFQNKKNQWIPIQDEILYKIHLDQLQYATNFTQKSQVFSETQQTKSENQSQNQIFNKSQKVNVSFSNLIKDQKPSIDGQQSNKKIKVNKILPNTILNNITSNIKNQISNNHLQKNQTTVNNTTPIDYKNNLNYSEHLQKDNFLLKETFIKRQHQLQLIAADLMFKKDHFQAFQKNSQLEKVHELKEKISITKANLNGRLKKLFLHYSNQNYDKSLSFDKNNEKSKQINLKNFLKYFKQIKEVHQELQIPVEENVFQKLKSGNLMNLFKISGKNKKQINFQQFLQINYDLFLNNGKDLSKDQKEINQDQYSKLQKTEIQKVSTLKKEYKNLKKSKIIFFNQKVCKILNISSKSKQLLKTQQFSFQNKTKQESKLNKTQQKPKSTKLERFIDQSLEDYLTTKSKIHSSFSNRHQKQIIYSLNQRLNSTQRQDKQIKNNPNFNASSKKSNSLKHTKNKQFNKTNFQSQGYEEINKLKKPQTTTSIKRQLFDQIIRQAHQQDEEDQNFNLFRSRKIKSLANLDDPMQNQSRKIKIKNFSSQKILSQNKQLKSIFSLPKIARLSQSQFESQSIVKTLDYLHQAIGKQEIPKIKRILEIDNPEKKKMNSLQNKYLNEYFSQNNVSEVQTQFEQTKKKLQDPIEKKCKKFKEENYKGFMKFS